MTIDWNMFIMLICFYIILPIMYFMLRSEATFRKNIALGVTLPYEAREDETVKEIIATYKRNIWICALLLTALLLPAIWMRRDSYALAYMMLWITMVVVGINIPYFQSHLRLKRLKLEQSWINQAAGKMLVDTKAAAEQKNWINPWWFAPPLLASAVPVIVSIWQAMNNAAFAWVNTAIYLVDALLIVVFYALYRAFYRQRAEVVDDNAARTIALSRVRRYHWSRCWLWLSYLTGGFNISVWLFRERAELFLVVTGIYTIAVVVVALYAEFSTRGAQHTLTVDSGKGLYVDEDAHWILGMFYYNPNDKRILINSRVGINTTINFARRGGKVILGLSAVVLLLLPLIGVWVVWEDQAPVILRVTPAQVIANHTVRTYTIAREDVVSVTLLEELPAGTRVAGTALDGVLKGNFILDGIGSCKLCLNPAVAPFIRIDTDSGVYVMGTGDPSQTTMIFQELLQE